MRGKVVLREALGSEIMVHFMVEARPALTEDVRELAADVGDDRVAKTEGGQTTMVGRFGARSRVTEGEEASVAVDTRSLHFFDAESGLGIYNDTSKGASG
jgi:multiple sugar transport system ATP-binding protein